MWSVWRTYSNKEGRRGRETQRSGRSLGSTLGANLCCGVGPNNRFSWNCDIDMENGLRSTLGEKGLYQLKIIIPEESYDIVFEWQYNPQVHSDLPESWLLLWSDGPPAKKVLSSFNLFIKEWSHTAGSSQRSHIFLASQPSWGQATPPQAARLDHRPDHRAEARAGQPWLHRVQLHWRCPGGDEGGTQMTTGCKTADMIFVKKLHGQNFRP